MTNDLSKTIKSSFEEYRTELFSLLSQPSISATGEGVEECAIKVLDMIESRDFTETSLIETETYPLIYSSRVIDESLPTILFYGHYDVQPPGDSAQWESPPFKPTIRDNSIYARGSGDNKGQFTTHIFAVDALDAGSECLSVNIKLLIEGGEENGSRGLVGYLQNDPSELEDVDLVYVSDGPMHASRRPTIIYGNRGNLKFELELKTADMDLHSGNYGGPNPNAANELVEALSSLFEGDQVTIDKFYNDISISETAKELATNLPVDQELLKKETGVREFITDKNYYERLLLEPTLTINGIHAGYGGEGSKTIIPHRASAKLDCRLVPNQDPERVFDRIVEAVHKQNPNIVVSKKGSFPPVQTPFDNPYADRIKSAQRAAWGLEPVEMPLMGGSLPAGYFRNELALPVLVVPYANPDEGNHSPNEHLDLDCFQNGIRTTAEFLRRFDK